MGEPLVQNKSACHHSVTFASAVAIEIRYIHDCQEEKGTGGQNINQLQLIILYGKRHYFKRQAGFIGKRRKK